MRGKSKGQRGLQEGNKMAKELLDDVNLMSSIGRSVIMNYTQVECGSLNIHPEGSPNP